MLSVEMENEIRGLALKSRMKFRMACVILNDGVIVGTGFNQPIAPTRLKGRGYRSLHAEVAAVKDMAGKYMEGKLKLRGERKNMYVVRVRPDGTFANAKPCPRCIAYIMAMGWRISEIHYTNEDGEFETIKLL